MSDKKKVIAKLREVVHGGNFPSRLQLLNWVNTLEQSEQQGPPSAVGQPSSGESSVQPGAIIDRFRSKIKAKENRLIELANELDTKGEYESAWRVRNQLFGLYDGLHLAEDSIKELQIEHDAKCHAAG